MPHMHRMHRLWNLVQRENLHRLLITIIGLTGLGSVVITWLEPDITLPNGIWWSFVTLTTVGYGDISPMTPAGRVVAIVIMFFGIGFLGLFSASIATEEAITNPPASYQFSAGDNLIVVAVDSRG